ncbi:MAG TPA: CPBP family intramembrane glutamic endopeptidase [Draconibacterium sp.]|nr:CPBP family intramembrane glutamic endopeptidase [Draconibacterium sp.]
MAFSAFRDMKPLSQLMFSIFVVIASFLAFMVLSLVIAIPLFGLDSMLSIPTLDELDSPESIRVLKYFQVVQSIGIFVVPPFILAWLYHGKIAEYLNLDKRVNFESVFLVLVLSFAASPFVNFIGGLNENMQFPEWLSGVENWMRNAEDKAAEITEAFLKVETVGGLAFNIFMIAFLPAIGEELLFRGVIQRIFTNWSRNYHWGIWISALLFSALHMQFYGFVPRVFLGVLFGYLLVWSGSMWLPIIAHFINNGVAIVAIYLIDKELLNPEIEEIGSTSDSFYMAVISLALIIIILMMIKRQNSKGYPEFQNPQ